jgi:hypothetical protein
MSRLRLVGKIGGHGKSSRHRGRRTRAGDCHGSHRHGGGCSGFSFSTHSHTRTHTVLLLYFVGIQNPTIRQVLGM